MAPTQLSSAPPAPTIRRFICLSFLNDHLHRGCHHAVTLGMTFLDNPDSFKEIKPKKLEAAQGLPELHDYLKSVTLDALIKELQANGITQKTFAESIGMSSRHLSTVKSSELRNRTFHELGATKLACLWVLEHIAQEGSG